MKRGKRRAQLRLPRARHREADAHDLRPPGQAARPHPFPVVGHHQSLPQRRPDAERAGRDARHRACVPRAAPRPAGSERLGAPRALQQGSAGEADSAGQRGRSRNARDARDRRGLATRRHVRFHAGRTGSVRRRAARHQVEPGGAERTGNVEQADPAAVPKDGRKG